jgi:cellulose 1,4-beta-cellobiosidase
LANPFAGAAFFINPEYVKKVEATAAGRPEKAAVLRKIEGYPTAVWLDSIASTDRIAATLEDADRQAKLAGKPVVVVFAVYDLPNRDCSAKSSAGELSVAANGGARYKAEFIDKIAAQFQAHPSLRIAAILEPDSLANLATNLDKQKCAESDKVYRHSIAYAISKLSQPHVSVYLDAAHAGWLGWDSNREKIVAIFKDVLTEAGGADKIRGFATNVSNYNILRGDDGHNLEPSDPCPDELTYVDRLRESLADAGIENKGFIVDTSRNGRGGIRTKWGSWCNVKGAGLGERPRAAPDNTLDAYFWVKPPGESDGTADKSATRFDAMCASTDAAPGAPEGGEWFESYFLELVKYANPPL